MAPIRIMVVEDELVVSKSIQITLRDLGYQVSSSVTSGEEAIKKAEEEKPDLILMDIALKGKMDGIEAAEWIHASLNIPIIFLTAYSDDKKLQRAKETEPFGYMVKPFQNRELKANIEMALYKANIEAKLRKRTHDLEERVKELNCLYGISNLIEKLDVSIEEILQGTADLIPPSWQYPEITCARIILEGQEYKTDNFNETAWKQASDIVMHGDRIGTVEVYYFEEKPEIDEGPFLKEERYLINSIAGLLGNITERKQVEEELEKTHQKLVISSRQAGMAEVATGILHNVGNALNSVNVSTTLITEKLSNSKIQNLKKVTDLIEDHIEDVEAFLTKDPQGKHIPVYLTKLSKLLIDEQAVIAEKLRAMAVNVNHIKEIINMQKPYSKVSSVEVAASLDQVVENAIEINQAGLKQHGIKVIRKFAEFRKVNIDKYRITQILVNLINNARYALSESEQEEKMLVIRFHKNGEDQFRIEVTDNGIGISRENLTKIFRHGFTTQKQGQGFELHNDALAAREMGGSLTVNSDGLEQGATFTLELPFKPAGIT